MKRDILNVLIRRSEVIEIEADEVPYTSMQDEYQQQAVQRLNDQ